MQYHESLSHLPFAMIDQLSTLGILPKKLAKIEHPKCPRCLYGKAHRKPWRTKAKQPHLKRASAPGVVVSVDQLESSVPGFVPLAKGTPTKRRYVGSTVFADHFSGLTYVHHQESLSTAETIEAKQAFERYAKHHGVTIRHYHCDNGRFADKAFQDSVSSANQSITFCGVNAHHQNGVAERRIRDITEASRTMLLHAAHRWPKTIISNLWPQALKHAVNVRNSVPRVGETLSPLSKFARTPVEPNLKHFHPFGCPCYVLENPLQARNPFPKWRERSRVGIYLGRSPHHASTVPLILNTQTGFVSPQFHVVYDDNFDTVTHDKQFKSLWQYKAKLQVQDQTTSDPDRTDTLVTDRSKTATPLREYATQPIPPSLATPWDTLAPSTAPIAASEGEIQPSAPSERSDQPSEGATNPQTVQQEPATQRVPATEGDVSQPQPQESTAPPAVQTTSPTPTPMTPTVTTRIAPQGHTRSGRTIRAPARFTSYAAMHEDTFSPSDIPESDELADMHPLAAALQSYAASKAKDPDTMTLERAMAEEDADECVKAMEKEILGPHRTRPLKNIAYLPSTKIS